MGEMKKRTGPPEADEIHSVLSSRAVTEGAGYDDVKKLATAMYYSGAFDRDSSPREGIAKLIIKIQKGRELGIPPIAAVSNVYVVDGKAALSATTMAALLKRSGKYRYLVPEHTAQKCTVVFLEKLDGKWEKVGAYTYTMEDAKLAGLTKKHNYQRHPKDMLFARALSKGARMFCPDALGGAVYLPDEVEPGAFDEPARPLEVETSSPEAQEVTKAIEQQPEPETITVSVKERAETVKAELKPEFRMAAEAFTPPPKKAEPKPEETQAEPPDEPSDKDLEERARELFPDPDEKPEEEEVDW